jgi:hypothetical protein
VLRGFSQGLLQRNSVSRKKRGWLPVTWQKFARFTSH